MRADEKYTFFFGQSETAGAVAVALRRRQGQVGQEVGVPVGTAFARFQGVAVRSEDFQPSVYPRVVFSDLVEAFERLVIRKLSGFRTPKVAAKALDAPDDAARFQIERSPVAFRLDGSAADEHDGANGVVVLLLFARVAPKPSTLAPQ